MTFGISRVHGSLIAPKNFSGVALQDFTLTFWNGNFQAGGSVSVPLDYAAGAGTAGGAFDQIFRAAVGTVASVSRVGTLSTATGAIRFAIEALGVDADSAGYLGTGPTNASPATTAAALQAAIQALGSVTVPGTTSTVVHLTSATVAAFTY